MPGTYMGGYNGYPTIPYYNPLSTDRVMPTQAQIQNPQVNQGILWVQGESGAKSYLVAPNTSVLLMDSENSKFYIKSTDQSGMPNLRTFEYKEISTNPSVGEPKGDTEHNDKFVTRNEFNDLYDKYEALSQKLSMKQDKNAPKGRNTPTNE